MKSRICPYRNHCLNKGICEDCDFGKAFEKMNAKIKRLKAKNDSLIEENKQLRERLEILTNPNF